MQRLSLNELNRKILSLLQERPEGLQTATIAKESQIDYFVVYQRLLRLKFKKIVVQQYKLWKITEKGRIFLLEGLVGLSRTTLTEIQNVKVEKAQNVKLRIPPKRANGVRISFYPLRTEYPKLESLFAEAGIDAKANKVKNYIQYELKWQGYDLKFTTRKLIAYAPMAFYGFGIEGKVLINEELNKAMNAVGSLVKQLKLRMIRENDRIKALVTYFEIAHTDSQQASRVTRTLKRIAPMAYDLQTLEMLSWMDRSFRTRKNRAESEFADLDIEALEADRQQDMVQGKWNHREEQLKLKRLEELQERQRQSEERILRISEATASQLSSLSEIVFHIQQPNQEKKTKRFMT